MKLVVIVPFLNEEDYLPTFLGSLTLQSRPPDTLLLVDDGSDDDSSRLAEDFASRHSYARALKRPPRPETGDRLARAAELLAFQWAEQQLQSDYDILVKVDADLRLPAEFFARAEEQLLANPRLGITGPFLSILASDGRLAREREPTYHIRGATKFYRRQCYEQISPIKPILGWDTIDEVTARLRGWQTASFAMPGGDPVHLRPTGAVDGRLRAFRRWGACSYAIGDHPMWLAAGAARRSLKRPWIIGALAYLVGWSGAWVRQAPRAPASVRDYVRGEQLRRLRGLSTAPAGEDRLWEGADPAS
jgi:poly-beta-1,6-N-acetyl-D-glucosamine synthase